MVSDKYLTELISNYAARSVPLINIGMSSLYAFDLTWAHHLPSAIPKSGIQSDAQLGRMVRTEKTNPSSSFFSFPDRALICEE